jgi:hypothetical protein
MYGNEQRQSTVPTHVSAVYKASWQRGCCNQVGVVLGQTVNGILIEDGELADTFKALPPIGNAGYAKHALAFHRTQRSLMRKERVVACGDCI